jgi:NADH dehydrogenase
MTIAVTGANGGVGRNLLAHVAERGDLTATAVVRSERAAAALPSSSSITPRIISFGDVGELTQVLQGASCVVHLAGILIESATARYESANVASTAVVVAAAQDAGVRHIVLVSVIGASTDSRNRYLRSKGEAESAVRSSGVPSTIIRTPMLLGRGTAAAAALVRTAQLGRARLLAGGHYSMRPLDLDDLSLAILHVCSTPSEGAIIHELFGPETVRYRDLVARAADMMGQELIIGTMPVWMAKVSAAITHRVRGGGISPTVIDVITADEDVRTNAAAELGVGLTPLSTTLEKILLDRAGAP